jgi:hypothetical protein
MSADSGVAVAAGLQVAGNRLLLENHLVDGVARTGVGQERCVSNLVEGDALFLGDRDLRSTMDAR